MIEPRSSFVDRCVKYHASTALPSLQTYLIAEQHERHVSLCGREGGEWVLTGYEGQGVIPLPRLNTSISLDEIYAGVFCPATPCAPFPGE
ncbi:hypothetical protein [Deinococcus apachensis]|uniref:hypothetical protein n=1 Tax=Deinococcus apachensis TaxID=309886 RepID=UPI00037C9935|nr:hypothetical protein [Deinococcus apachensis]